MHLQAERYEQILARRAEGISQNLHRALARHKKLVTEDVTAALIEHVRSSIMYERQHLRELDALKTDVSSAASKHVPAKPVPPRPTVVPPLEDFSKPPIPRPSSGLSSSANGASAVARAPSVPPSFQSPAVASSTVDPLGSGSAVANPPQSARAQTVTSSMYPAGAPLQSPGAGPSSAGPSSPVPQSARSPSFTPPPSAVVSDGPPLGGRFVDGTKSMFVRHTPSPLSAPATPSKSAFQSPLHSAGPMSAAPHPLAQSASMDGPLGSAGSQRSNGQDGGLDPLGSGKPAFMSASVRVQPTRPRLDAREAASKLANMF